MSKKCTGGCGRTFPLSHFGTHTRKGKQVVYATCPGCRTKAIGRALKYQATDKGKAALARANKSDVRKAIAKRQRKSEKGKARIKRFADRQKERYHSSPAYAMRKKIACSAACLASFRYKKSPTFVQRTAFSSEAQFIKHLKERLPAGTRMSEHGVTWDIEHTIPQEAYNFANPVDIKRCWSPANVRAMTVSDNGSKGYKIVDSLCMQVGVQYFPVDWNGCIPSDEEKATFYAKCASSE